jgi:hypothetical protein
MLVFWVVTQRGLGKVHAALQLVIWADRLEKQNVLLTAKLTKQLTQRLTSLLEKLMVTKLVKKFPMLFVT